MQHKNITPKTTASMGITAIVLPKKQFTKPDYWHGFYIAALQNNTESLKNLIEKGADVNAKNKYEQTTLHYAAREGHTEIVEFLIEKGADVNAKNKYGLTPLHFAAKIKKPRKKPEIKPRKASNINIARKNLAILVECAKKY